MSDDGSAPNELWVVQLGLTEYDEALSLQRRVHAARADALVADVLLLLEHPPVYTRGRRAEASELPFGEDWYRDRGIDLRDVDRGGKTTYHGPGQLVGYPIVDTRLVGRDIVRFVGVIEEAVIAALAGEGVRARRDPAGRGVWAGEGKIASLGLHVACGVTSHGFAVNVDCDLEPFSWIKPCGLDDPVTSLAAQTGEVGRMPRFSRRVVDELASGLGLRPRLLSRESLLTRLEAAEGAPRSVSVGIDADDLVLAP